MRLCALLLALLPSLARASPLDVQLEATALLGQSLPAVIVSAHQAAKDVRLTLDRSGCGTATKVELSTPKIAAGQDHRFKLDQPAGHCRYQGELSANLGGQRAVLPLSFETSLSGPPEVKALPQAFDRDTHTVRVTFTHEADHGKVEAFGEAGQKLGTVADQPLGDLSPGEPLSLSYDDQDRAVVRLRVTISDSAGAFAAVDLFPWSLAIPHQEVVFDTGSAAIGESEAPKLEESLRQIRAGLAKVDGQIPVRLFVAGYTDTVGAEEANQKLSALRAESIAGFFRKRGLRLPILTAGLGEAALAVSTPDETPESRNRRAQYILAVDPPPIEGSARPAVWKPLP